MYTIWHSYRKVTYMVRHHFAGFLRNPYPLCKQELHEQGDTAVHCIGGWSCFESRTPWGETALRGSIQNGRAYSKITNSISPFGPEPRPEVRSPA